MSTGHVNDWVRYAGNEPLDGPTMYGRPLPDFGPASIGPVLGQRHRQTDCVPVHRVIVVEHPGFPHLRELTQAHAEVLSGELFVHVQRLFLGKEPALGGFSGLI